jgi:hypothetical protein
MPVASGPGKEPDMTDDELRDIMVYLEERVVLESPESRTLVFQAPSADEMASAGLHPQGSARLLAEPWWDEMVEDILETADFCEPSEAPAKLLRYARDVVQEYVRKRFKP